MSGPTSTPTGTRKTDSSPPSHYTRDKSPTMNNSRILVDIDESVSPPTHTRQPGAGGHHGRRARDRHRGPPSREPRRRRPWIETPRPGNVLAPVLEHIDERVPHFSRCSEPTCVVPVAPYRAAPPERTVHCLRHTDGESLHPRPEASGGVSLHEKMDVVRLDAEVQESEFVVRGRSQGGAHHGEDARAAQRRQASPSPERHV